MSESEPKSKRSWTDWVLWFVAIATLLGFIGVCYKAFGVLGNAFLATILILVVIYTLVEIFRGLKVRKPRL